MEAAHPANVTVQRGPWPSYKGEGSKSFRPTYDRIWSKQLHSLAPFACDPEKAMALLDKWIRDGVLILSKVYLLPSREDQDDLTYCLY